MSLIRRFYHRLPIFRELIQIRDALNVLTIHSNALRAAQRQALIHHELATADRYADRRKLAHHEFQVFSQNGEDGIIAEIFRRIGTRSRTFIELGVGEGLENNTAFLLTQGWRGGWIEGDRSCARQIQNEFHSLLEGEQLNLVNAFMTAENVASLVAQLGLPNEVDFLSIDIDRNTSHVWKALSQVRARVVAVEYNATFPADVEWEVPYDAHRVWNHSAYFGASLKTMDLIGQAGGYVLVGCDLSGTNAFFVRADEDLSSFATPFTPENHYEPARYWITLRAAHARRFAD